MTNELWVPDSYKTTVLTKAETAAPGEPRSNLFPSPSNHGSLSLGLYRPVGVGSPHLTRQELIGLYRRHSWVRAALRRIALIAISEGWEIVRDDETPEEQAPADEYEYLKRFFEPELSAVTNIRQTQLPRQKMIVTIIRLRLLGEVYWELAANGFGEIVDWVPMYGTVLPLIDRKGNFLDPSSAYVQLMGTNREFFGFDEVLRFELPDIDGRLGVSDLEAAEVAITTDLYASAWNRNTFKNNRVPPGAWMFDPSTTPADMKANREALDSMYGGVEGANNPYLALKGTVDYKVFGQPFQRDQEYLKGRRFNRDEILAILGMSPGILGIVEDVNRASMQGLIEIAYRQEAAPLQDIIEETINLWIKAVGITAWRFRFIRPSFGNEADEASTDERLIKSGQATPNQRRAAKGLPGYPGGDRYYMPQGMIEVGRDPDDEMADEEAREIGAPSEEPAPDDEDENDDEEQEEGDEDVEEKRAEVRRWKRVAMRMAKGEISWRPFKSRVLPRKQREAIEADIMQMRDDPEGIRAYFDALLDPNYGPGKSPQWFHDQLKDDLGQSTPAEQARLATHKVEEGLDGWPEYARNRLNERLRTDLDYQADSLEERSRRLEEADLP